MEILKTILIIISSIILSYIIIRVFAYGVAKSVIDAIQQNIYNRKENKNGIKKETRNERETTKQNGTE